MCHWRLADSRFGTHSALGRAASQLVHPFTEGRAAQNSKFGKRSRIGKGGVKRRKRESEVAAHKQARNKSDFGAPPQKYNIEQRVK